MVVEATDKHAAAVAVDWPGWARHLRGDVDDALEALAAYAPRYADVPRRTGLTFEPDLDRLEVLEQLPGRHPDMGPGARSAAGDAPLTGDEGQRLAALLQGCWGLLDDVLEHAPEQLRKGPRGGGRDRGAVREHVDAAQGSYGLRIGIRGPKALGPVEVRRRLLAALRGQEVPDPPDRNPWPLRHAALVCGWHATDHAFEVQDRSES